MDTNEYRIVVSKKHARWSPHAYFHVRVQLRGGGGLCLP
ncbi:hypothetical protein SABIM44S_02978 [Streptomyces abikoensis]